MEYLVLYKRKNGEIIERYRKTLPPYEIGETTCMGWVVIDIKHQINSKFLSGDEYVHELINCREKARKSLRHKVSNALRKILYVLDKNY